MHEADRSLSLKAWCDERDSVEPGSDDADGYHRAIRYCADEILRLHFAERLVNKIFGRNLQSHGAGLVLVMHCEAELGRGSRPTLATIQREMGPSRTLAAFFALLRLSGYLLHERVPHDGRSAWLVPSPLLFDGLRQWLVHHVRCSEMVGLATPGLAARLCDDEAACRRYIGHARALLDRTRTAMAGEGAWAWFDRFDCGDRIGLTLLRAHFASAPAGQDGRRWFAFASRRVATQLGLSHSHVRNVLNRAEAQGLLWQERAAGRIALSPRLLAESEAWFRLFWGWIAETGRDAGLA